MVADPEVVVEIRSQRVRVGEQGVLVHTWLGDAGDGNRADVGVVAVVPVVAEIQSDFVADILIDAGEDLVDDVLACRIRLDVVGGARPVRGRIVLQQLERDRGQL